MGLVGSKRNKDKFKGSKHEGTIFFPDKGMPCRYFISGEQCRRKNCSFLHESTGLLMLLRLIKRAKSSLKICVFTITCNEIAEAILDVHKRGVQVCIITDNDQASATGSDINQLSRAGIRVIHDNSQVHMHHKFALVDDNLLLTGSFNWTRSVVLSNWENILYTDNIALVTSYVKEFNRLRLEFKSNTIK